MFKTHEVRAMTSIAGAIILSDKNKTLLFKNRDLSTTAHKDELFYDVDCFGIRGIDMKNGKVTGLSIGVNRFGLAAANTHVMKTDQLTYDLLTEQILMFAKNAEDGLTMVVEHLKTGRRYQWGNLILADNSRTLAIEIAGDEHTVEWSDKKVLRTGHHIMLDTEEKLRQINDTTEDLYDDSVARFNRGYDLLRQAKSVSDVIALLQDHGDAPSQASICRHPTGDRQIATVMSYLVEVDHQQETGKPGIKFNFCRGNPCSNSFSAIPLLFPADEEVMKRAHSMYFK